MGRHEARLSRWVDIVGEVLRQPLAELPYAVVHDELTETFDADATGLHWMDPTGVELLHVRPAEHDVDGYAGLRPVATSNPLARWYATTRSPAPQSQRRVPSSIADARCAATWVEASRPYGVTEMLCIPLVTGPDRMRAHLVARQRGDFTDEEFELARRLQPALAGLDRQAAELRRWQEGTTAGPQAGDGGADRGRAAVQEARLTGRELTVLPLLAEGLTAAAIGRRLVISTRTVHKHLEHVYTKLGTADRLTTVLRARQMGLLP
jgi:DNA-binding CsgD family transcriptional regulator